MKPYEVNIRVVYSLHSCGLGHTGLEKLCCMLMPAPMIVTNYNKISNTLRDAAKIVAVKSMKDAVVDAKKYREGIADIGVSVDGTWQERGTLIAILQTLEKLRYMLNKRRKYLATYKSKDSTKKARTIIRAERKVLYIKQVVSKYYK